MQCEFYREVCSARLDGAASELEANALDAHLAGCPDCRAWAAEATKVTALARLAPADRVPDLTARIMAAAPVSRPGSVSGPASLPGPAPAIRPVPVARLGLVMVALAQLAIAVPALLGNDAGAPVHIAREQGSWALALAVGLLFAAWRPARADGILPVLGVLVACLAATTTLDVVAGRAAASGEAPHALAGLGLVLLWLAAHPGAGTGQTETGRAGPGWPGGKGSGGGRTGGRRPGAAGAAPA